MSSVPDLLRHVVDCLKASLGDGATEKITRNGHIHVRKGRKRFVAKQTANAPRAKRVEVKRADGKLLTISMGSHCRIEVNGVEVDSEEAIGMIVRD